MHSQFPVDRNAPLSGLEERTHGGPPELDRTVIPLQHNRPRLSLAGIAGHGHEAMNDHPVDDRDSVEANTHYSTDELDVEQLLLPGWP